MSNNHSYQNYYSIDSKTFSTKLFAAYYKEKTQSSNSIIWHFPNWESKLASIDITKEPEESLSELYLKRALQLRHAYDYLVLFYSGGHDSNQILETFMLNGIFIDEILIFKKGDKRLIEKFPTEYDLLTFFPEYYEAEKSALPQATFYVETFSPKTKITMIEKNLYELNNLYWKSLSEKNLKENIRSSNLGINYRPFFRSKNLSYINNSWKNISENKKIGYIYGKEKAKISYDDVGYFIYLSDINVVDYVDINNILSEYDLPNNMELFYIHPQFVEIHIKQAHLMMNKLPKSKISTTVNPVFCTREIEDLYSEVIYNRKYKRIYTDLKSTDYLVNNLKEKSILSRKYEMIDLGARLYMSEDLVDSSSNFNKFLSIVKNSFFPNSSITSIIDKNLNVYSTKKYYIKYY